MLPLYLLCILKVGEIEMSKIILAAGFISTFIFGANEAISQCMCAYLPGGYRLPAHEALKSSDVVFTGEIVEVKKGVSSNQYDVKFKIQIAWKKDVGETIVLRTYKESCGFFGEKGEQYLVYAYMRDGMLTTNGCTRTEKLDEASADLKEFEEKGEKPVKQYETK